MEGDLQLTLPPEGERVIRREADRPALEERTPTQAESEFVRGVLDRFRTMSEAEKLQRKRSYEEVEFNSGVHWDSTMRKEREDKERVVMEINRTPQYLNQVSNSQRMTRPAILIKPNGNGADEEQAGIKQGIIKSIEKRSDAESIRDDGFYAVLEKGWTYWRVSVEWEHEKSNRQVIRTRRIFDDFSVYCDPAATEPDRSDAMDWFITHDYPLESYPDEFGTAPSGWASGELTSTEDPVRDWIGDKTIRVAEYWYKERKKEKLYILADDPLADGRWEDELERNDETGRLVGVAYVEEEPVYRWSYRQKIYWCLINARGVIYGNEGHTAGREYVKGAKHVPIVRCEGRKYLIDKRVVYAGMVRDAIEPCLASDYWLSAITEMVALGPKAPWVVAYDAIAQYREMWDQANVENYAALYYDRWDAEGNELPAPVRQFGEPPIQAMTFILNFAEEDIKRVMGIYQRSLGAEGPEHSGVAINAVQREADIANFNYVDNLKRSIAYEARIYLDLIPRVLDAPQVMDIVRPTGKTEKVTINAEFKKNGQSKKYDMAVGDYDVEVEVGPSMATRREAAAQGINEYLKVDPQAAPFVGDLLARNLDFPDKAELEKRLRQRAAAAGVKAEDPMDEADVPEEFKQLYKQQSAQLEQVTQAAQQMQEAMKTDEAKFAHEREIAAMKIASEERIAALNADKELAKAEMADKAKSDLAMLQASLQQVQADVEAFRQAGPVEWQFDHETGQITPPQGQPAAQNEPQGASA